MSSSENYSVGNERFDEEATKWDSKPEVVASSSNCLQSILARLGAQPGLQTVLEIGCGTGLLTIPLSKHASNVFALDASRGMIERLRAKLVEDEALNNKIRAEVKLLDDPNDPVLEGNRFDLVVSHLVFHHIPDMQRMVNVMYGCCSSNGGRVWISDFEDNGPQAMAFHPKSKHDGVERHGLKRSEMEDILKLAGFKDVDVFCNFELDKTIETGVKQTFPFIVATGIRQD